MVLMILYCWLSATIACVSAKDLHTDACTILCNIEMLQTYVLCTEPNTLFPPLTAYVGIVCIVIGVRANIHLGGGQTEFCPNVFGFGGGGGSSRNFPGSIFCGVPDFFPVNSSNRPSIRVFFR